MKQMLFKKLLCVGISIVCMISLAVPCRVNAEEEMIVWDTLLPGEEYYLDDFSEWRTGKYSEKSGEYESWPGRICYTKDIAVVPEMVYQLFETDNTYDIQVIQLDDAYAVLESDSYKNGGEVVMTEETAYVRIGIYNPGNYSMTSAQYEEVFLNGYCLSLVLPEDYSYFLEDTDLTNAGLWEKGKYTAENGEENTASSVRLKDYKEVQAGATYSCFLSATDCVVTVVQLDESMNVLGSRTVKNGSEYTMDESAKYVRISVTDTVTYNLSVSAFTALCESGLELGFELIEDYSDNVLDTDLSNIALWESGLFTSADGTKTGGDYAIRLIDRKTCMPEAKYEVVSSNEEFRLSVLEYAEDGTYIKINQVKHGESFVTDSLTAYLGISVCIPGNYSMSYATYGEEFLAEEFELALVPGAEWEEPAEPETDSLESCYMVMEDSIVQLSIQDDSYRVLLSEYDSELQCIATADLGNLDYHYINENTEYVSMAVYQYVNGEEVEDSYELITEEENCFGIELLAANDLSNESEAEALFGPELNKASSSNIANYRYGWYKSWGGTYEYTTDGICSRNYYRVTMDTYYVNINDSRIGVSIREYDENGEWLSCIGSMYNGDVYTPSEDAVYVTLVVKSTEWATGPYDLLRYGLVIDFAGEMPETGIDTIAIEEFDFTNPDNWRSGNYVYTTGAFGLNEYSICISDLLSVESLNGPMMVNLWNSYLKMSIVELQENGTPLCTTTLYDGQKWTKQEDTCYVGISVSYDKNYDYSYYKEQWAAGYINTLELFEKYEYNTNMNPMTAEEFMDIMNVGWNLGNSLDSHYGDRDEENPALGQERIWGNVTVTRELIDHIAELGFNTIRIPVTWYYNTYTDEQGNLRVHEAWFDRVQDVVDYAIANDMYVFLNTHHEQPIIFTGTDEETFAQVLSDAEDLWREIATYFKDYDEHLIFEAYNEVDNIEQSWSYSEKSAEQMNRLNQVFVDTVRAVGGNNEYRLLCAPTLLDGYDNLILSDYIKPEDPAGEGYLLTQIHTYSYQFDQDIEAQFANLEQFAEENNLPVIIGEFGTKPSYSPLEYREEAAANFVARAKEHGLGCIYWDDGNLNNYGLVDRRDFEASEHEILDALLNPQAYCSTNKIILDSMEDFVYMSLNQSTGELKEDKYWGTIVTDNDGYGVEIPAGTDYITLNLVTTNGATLQKIHYIHFYDAELQFISAFNNGNGFWNKTLEVPADAVYVRVGINNSYAATNVLKYHKFFWFGEMKLTVGFIDTEDDASLVVDPMDGTTPVVVLEPSQPEGLISFMEDIDFSDFYSYESGSYYYSNGIKEEDAACIRIPEYIEVQENACDTYVYTTSKSGVRLNVIQLDADMKFLGNTELVNNKSMTLEANTKYLAITISNPYVDYEVDCSTYQQFFEEGMMITFEVK